MLKIEDLHVYYGGIHALKGLSLEVADGQIVTLIGANGAGKSSTLRSISGLVKNKKGKILFEGRNILGKNPETTSLRKSLNPILTDSHRSRHNALRPAGGLGYTRFNHKGDEPWLKSVKQCSP